MKTSDFEAFSGSLAGLRPDQRLSQKFLKSRTHIQMLFPLKSATICRQIHRKYFKTQTVCTMKRHFFNLFQIHIPSHCLFI